MFGSIAASTRMKAGRMDELSLHPTVKPVEMIADAIRDVSGRGDIVFDVFGGSGSTLIAAEKTGRRARLPGGARSRSIAIASWRDGRPTQRMRQSNWSAGGNRKTNPEGGGGRMTQNPKGPGKALTARPSYKVGYGKPPVETRFKKGQSVNPKGRPKGSKTKRPGLREERMKDIILDEAYRGITVRDGDRNVTIPMAQAVIRALAVNAAKGDHRSQRLFAQRASRRVCGRTAPSPFRKCAGRGPRTCSVNASSPDRCSTKEIAVIRHERSVIAGPKVGVRTFPTFSSVSAGPPDGPCGKGS
jgi:hypothetical protein